MITRRLVRIWIGILCCAFLSVTSAWAQRAAELAGVAKDASGAVMVGVQVSATNQETGVKTSTRTNESGLYRIVELVAGSYKIEATLSGFKTYVSTVVLESSRVTPLDIAMQVGEVAETIEVQAEAPTLETGSQTVGNVVEEKLVKELPTVLRRPAQLVLTTAGITYNGIDPTNTMTPFFSLAGGKQLPAFYIDGGNATNVRVESNVLDINPSIEVTKEFRIIANNPKAEYGGSGSGLMLMTTKSGTNDIHGNIWEFHRQKALNARNFFAAEPLPFREHIFGASVGGPILKNKLHFFGTYEGTKSVLVPPLGNNSSFTLFQSLPTVEQRAGDFSKTYNIDGSLRTIYDPYSTVVNPDGTVTRTAFPGNIIPANRVSPIAKRIADYLPAPNRPAQNITGFNNFSGFQRRWMDRASVTARIDYEHSQSDKFFHRFLWESVTFEFDGPWPGIAEGQDIRGASQVLNERNPADGGDQVLLPWSKNFLTGWTHIFNPQVVSDLRVTYSTRSWGGHHSSSGLGFPQKIGLPIPANVPSPTQKFGDHNDHFPAIAFPGSQYTMPSGAWLGAGDYQLPMRNFNAVESVTWLKNNHSFKVGYEVRRSTANFYTDLNSNGTYNFAARGTARTQFDAASGDPFASFLLDWPDSGSLLGVGFRSLLNWWHSGYVQDDWRVTPNFTVNLGLRYEFDTSVVEQRGPDWLNGFDVNAINPVCNCRGTFTFPKNLYDTDPNNFMPRMGFAWTPRGSTVIRGGYGVFFVGPVNSGARGTPGTNRPDAGASVDTATTDAGLTAPYFLRTGLPAQPPFEPSQLNPGFGAVPIGQRPIIAPAFMDRNLAVGYNQHFNLNIQHQLPNGVFFELGWLANMGHKLQGTLSLNQVSPERVGAATTQVDRPFPQFSNVSQLTTGVFNSSYHAFVIKGEKRYAKGLTFVSHYTWSKFLDDFSQSNIYNRGVNKGLSSDNRTHRFVFSGVYELPFGRGRDFLKEGALSHILGGWNIGAVNIAQSGRPLNANASPNLCNCFSSGGVRANQIGDPKGPKTINNWFNLAAFQHPGSFVFGNSAPGVIIGPGLWTLDLSIGKDFSFSEHLKLNFRADLFNSLNHTNFENPSTNIFPAGAGGTTNVITAAGDPRIIQLSARFFF